MNKVQWMNSYHGLEALLNPINAGLGFALLFLSRTNGLLFIINTTDDTALYDRAHKKLVMNSLYFLVFFLYFIVSVLKAEGYSFDSVSGIVGREKFKYLHNLVEMPLVMIIFICGVISVIRGIAAGIFGRSRKGIWYSGAGTFAVGLALFLTAGFNSTAFYPSSENLQDSLTIRNASSSYFTLKTMMFVSFIIPFVFMYIWHAWRSVTRKKIDAGEMESEEHSY
jgi:cytochrome d ubiquinol oxidase subunit II